MNILTVLVQEKELLYEMLDTLKKEKEVLINDNVKELEKIIMEKEELKYRIDEVEKARIGLCGDKKLADILKDMDSNERHNTENLGREIEGLVYDIQQVNYTNGLLIKQSLNYIRAVMNVLAPKKTAVYRQTGRMEEAGTSSSILNKSV